MPVRNESATIKLPERRLRLPAVMTHREAREAEFGSLAAWPMEAAFILSALDAGNESSLDRRVADRTMYRTVGQLRLFSDERTRTPWIIYTRDVAPRGVGFITRHRLPLGYGGTLRMTGPEGVELTIDCAIRRCREQDMRGVEGALSLDREQWRVAG